MQMSRFYAAAIGRDGGTSYRHGKHSACAELNFDNGAKVVYSLTLEGFERDGAPWVRLTYNGRELAVFPFEQAGDLLECEEVSTLQATGYRPGEL
jgi:hypothetical protein